VAFNFNIFSPNTHLRPKLACEITPEGVIAARRAETDQVSMSFASLPHGVLTPGLKTPNVVDQARVVAALNKALDDISARERQLTVVVPDAAVRVLILDFDTLPSKRQDILPILRFRLRKLVPFEVDDAAVSYQIMSQQEEQTRALVTVMPAAVLAEYESTVRAAGYEPGAVLPSTLASLASLTSTDPSLVVNRNGLSVTTAITRADDLLLHRTLELPVSEDSHQEELAQTVSVAMAYFEDTLQTTPKSIYYVGPGGAAEFIRTLGDNESDRSWIRDLVLPPATGASSAIPNGLVAGVTGALATA